MKTRHIFVLAAMALTMAACGSKSGKGNTSNLQKNQGDTLKVHISEVSIATLHGEQKALYQKNPLSGELLSEDGRLVYVISKGEATTQLMMYHDNGELALLKCKAGSTTFFECHNTQGETITLDDFRAQYGEHFENVYAECRPEFDSIPGLQPIIDDEYSYKSQSTLSETNDDELASNLAAELFVED